MCIPRSMQQEFLEIIHNDYCGAHEGRDKTIARAKENGWWPTMREDVLKYVKSCMKCRLFKTTTHKFKKMTSV